MLSALCQRNVQGDDIGCFEQLVKEQALYACVFCLGPMGVGSLYTSWAPSAEKGALRAGRVSQADNAERLSVHGLGLGAER